MPLEVFINALVIFANLWVGCALLRRGAASGELPPKLLGASLVADGVEWLLWTLALYSPAEGTLIADFLGAGCRLGIAVANGLMLGFVYVVFRPGQRWAAACVLIVNTLLTVGLVVGIMLGDWMGYRSDRPWLWLEVVSSLVAYAWVFLEAGSEYLRMRRRLAHGLADPVVVDRMRLWCAYGFFSSISQVLYIAAILIAAVDGAYPAMYDNLMVFASVTATGGLWLAFISPEAYRRWVTARHGVRAG